jgi:hypothetical protein
VFLICSLASWPASNAGDEQVKSGNDLVPLRGKIGNPSSALRSRFSGLGAESGVCGTMTYRLEGRDFRELV